MLLLWIFISVHLHVLCTNVYSLLLLHKTLCIHFYFVRCCMILNKYDLILIQNRTSSSKPSPTEIKVIFNLQWQFWVLNEGILCNAIWYFCDCCTPPLFPLSNHSKINLQLKAYVLRHGQFNHSWKAEAFFFSNMYILASSNG